MKSDEIRKNAAELIVEAVDFASVMSIVARDCGIKVSASLYLNIRDAMFHFKALCDCQNSNNENLLKNYYNLKEHLTRGMKDAIICQVQSVCDAVHEVMQKSDFSENFDKEDVKQFQVQVHRLKDVVLKLRLSGTDLSKDAEFSVADALGTVKDCIIRITGLCREKDVQLF